MVLCALRRKNRVQMAVLAVLATSGVLPVLIQASTRTTTSFSGYVGFGAWFAAAAAGYALTRLPRSGGTEVTASGGRGTGLAAVVLPSASWDGLRPRRSSEGGRTRRGWSPSFVPSPRLIRATDLAEGYSVPAYYLEGTTSWDLWSGTWYFRYRRPGVARPLTGMAAYVPRSRPLFLADHAQLQGYPADRLLHHRRSPRGTLRADWHGRPVHHLGSSAERAAGEQSWQRLSPRSACEALAD